MSIKSNVSEALLKEGRSKRSSPSAQSARNPGKAKSAQGVPRRAPTKVAEVANGHGNPSGKLARISELLKRPTGATIDTLIKETGWQGHSVRAAITGLRKKGFAVTLAKHESGPSTYHAATKR